jgi:hypothetical protein
VKKSYTKLQLKSDKTAVYRDELALAIVTCPSKSLYERKIIGIGRSSKKELNSNHAESFEIESVEEQSKTGIALMECGKNAVVNSGETRIHSQ